MRRRGNKQIRRINEARNGAALYRLAYAFEGALNDFAHTFRYATDPKYAAEHDETEERNRLRNGFQCRCVVLDFERTM